MSGRPARPAPDASGLPTPAGAGLAAAAGCLLPLAGSLWHILERAAPPVTDEAHYLTNSLRLWQTLGSDGIAAFCASFAHAMGTKAPLLTLAPFPFYALFGQGLHQALPANLAALAVASLYAYRIGKTLHSPWAGAMAVWCLNLTPVVYGLSRTFFPETWLAALAAGFVYHLLAGGGAVPLGVFLGLGLLCKITFPLYVAVPAVLLADRRRTAADWAKTLAVAGAIAAAWYAFNLRAALGFASSAAFGKISTRRSSALGLLTPASYTRVLLGQCWSRGLAACALASAAAALRLRPRWKPDADWRTPAAMLGWWLFPLAVLICSPNQMWRYTVPALAGAAIGLGGLMGAAASRLGRRGLWAAALALAWPARDYWAQTTGHGLFPASGTAEAWVCNGPPNKEGQWGQEEFLSVLAEEAAKTPGTKSAWVIVAAKYFNQMTAGYYAVLHRWPLAFTPMKIPDPPEEVLARALDRDIHFIVTVESAPDGWLTNPVNRRLDEVRGALESGRWPYRVGFKRALANGAVAVVFRRMDAPAYLKMPGPRTSKF